MRKWNYQVIAALTLLIVAIYARLWNAPYLTWDDDSNIFNNPYFTMHRWWDLWNEPYFGLYVPVTSSAWAGLYYLAGGAAWPFRAFNLLMHALNTLLVFLMLSRLARHWKIKQPWCVALAAGVFAVHPLQVEAVAWISGGRDLLSTFFSLLAVWIYLAKANRKGYLLATVLFFVALLCKPNVAILPLAIVLGEFLLKGEAWSNAAMRMLPWFVGSLGAVMVTHGAQVDYFVNQINTWNRPLLVFDSFAFYIQKLLWPFPLSANYARTADKVLGEVGVLGITITLVIMALVVLAYFAWSDRRPRVGYLWFVLLLPVSGLVPFGYENISGVADHYAYLPMACIAALLMLLWNYIWRWKPLRVLPIVLLVLWSAASWSRAQVWRDDDHFFSDMAVLSPDAYNTALGMSVVMCQDRKDFAGGVQWTEKALRARPADVLALANRAYCLLRAEDYKAVIDMDNDLQGLDHDKMSATQPTGYSSLIASIGTALIKDGHAADGFQYLCEAYRIKPSEPNHVHNLKAAADILQAKGLDAVCEDEDAGAAEGEDADTPDPQ